MAHTEISIEDEKIYLTIPVEEVTPDIKRNLEERLRKFTLEVIPVKKLSADQNAFMHVLFKQYGEELGYEMIEQKEVMKEQFAIAYDLMEFSTSKCTMDQANEFIAYMIEHAIENDINLYIRNKREKKARHVLEIDFITQRYVIACLRKKMCAACGKIHNEYNTVELHHWKSVASTVGTYEDDDGLSTPFISLCTFHHSEFHNIGVESFKNKWHIEGVWLNEKLVYDLLDIYPRHFKLFRKYLKEGKYKNLKR